jgi:hypothetical protein
VTADRQDGGVFHLYFVRLFVAGREKAGFIDNQGCNLRFFFGSVRYSEDLDLDVRRVPPEALKERVDSILGSNVQKETLAAAGLVIDRVTAPKQTPTTQRWKIALLAHGRNAEVGTKIEFSRRKGEGARVLRWL